MAAQPSRCPPDEVRPSLTRDVSRLGGGLLFVVIGLFSVAGLAAGVLVVAQSPAVAAPDPRDAAASDAPDAASIRVSVEFDDGPPGLL
jgi:hypothetical protein